MFSQLASWTDLHEQWPERAILTRAPVSEWGVRERACECRDRASRNLRGVHAPLDYFGSRVRASSFDLICASLVFQWFEDLPHSLLGLTDLLSPGGALAFSTLSAESFPEWQAAHHDIGARSAVRGIPGG